MPVNRVLTLGCGNGEFERNLAKLNYVREHDALDVAEGAIEKARRAAREEGYSHIQYRVADLNQVDLPKDRYDVIFGISSVHHVAGLEHLFAQVYSSLKPGGYFFLDEYVGASQYQWPDQQLGHINRVLEMLPQRFKFSLSRPGETKPPVARPTVEEMNAVDPSEAVRSSEIGPLLERYFEQVEFRGYGGGLLHMLLEDIAGNFAEDDSEALCWLQRIFSIEDSLLEQGELEHDFAVLIGRKPTRYRVAMEYLRTTNVGVRTLYRKFTG